MITFSDIIPGFFAGISQTIIGYPFDTAVIYKQTEKNIRDIKLKYLYRGVQFPLLFNGIISSVCFSMDHNIYNYTKKNNISDNHYLSGAITGLTTSIIICPIELYKIRMQKLKTIKLLDNPFIGLRITIIREFIASGSYFGLYNYLINNELNSFTAGGITGCVSWVISYPIDVVKTRLQSGECNTILQGIKMKNLWSGISLCLFRAYIVNAVGFCVYEYFKNTDNRIF
tara:strand:+ start:2034 stop:2717 length:684 start_codon:yes stop_codon:yes gene_type:complete